MEFLCPAKINLYLEVVGKRPDGYHDLNTLMCPIGLFDSLHFTFGQKKIRVACDHPQVPNDQTNLAFRAAELFLRATDIKEGVYIDIKKNIPVGAGLGGGSSNAAATLISLNAQYGYPLSQDKLSLIGRSLGADVPFFIFGKPAVATGIGDILEPFNSLVSYQILLIYPSMKISTSEVYRKLNLTLTKNKKKISKYLFNLDWGLDAPKLLYNDLEAVASAICPDIQTAKESLRNAGAQGAIMTGSGSAVFGLFNDSNQADKAYRLISSDQRSWQLFRTHMIV